MKKHFVSMVLAIAASGCASNNGDEAPSRHPDAEAGVEIGVASDGGMEAIFDSDPIERGGPSKGVLYEPDPATNADDMASYPHAIRLKDGTILATFERQLGSSS